MAEELGEPIKYGDVFEESGEVGRKPIAQKDAAAMQAAESMAIGNVKKGGPAALAQSAADINERRGLLPHDAVTNVTSHDGVAISEEEVNGQQVFTEAIGGQVVGQYVQPSGTKLKSPSDDVPVEAMTIGQALEAAAGTAGDKLVDQSDAAAIEVWGSDPIQRKLSFFLLTTSFEWGLNPEAAEIRATGRGQIIAGGIAAAAQSAAAHNIRVKRDEEKIKLRDILEDAKAKLPDDKAVTKVEADGILNAELRNKEGLSPYPGGVADSIVTAARLNHEKKNLKS